MKKPTLSIITVNFNNNNGLVKTLQSIKAQTYTDYEHIIIDANSTDGSTETIINYSKKAPYLTYWVSEKDEGIYDGMNKGIKQAKGEYLYFLNSGDCLQKDILKKVSFDGTKYIYGDMILNEESGKRNRFAPDILSLIFFFYDSLSHQACFIHHSLFTNRLYDTRYKIISDWAHSVQCIIMENCNYQHIPYVIAECDGTGISSNYINVQTERIKWFQDNFPEQIYSAIIDMLEYKKSEFSSIIPKMNRSKKFSKRACKLIKVLFKIHLFFSSRKSSQTDIKNSILYRPFSPKHFK